MPYWLKPGQDWGNTRLEMRIGNSTDEPNISHHRKGCNHECKNRLRKSTRVSRNLVRYTGIGQIYEDTRFIGSFESG